MNRFLFICPSFNPGRTPISGGGNYPLAVRCCRMTLLSLQQIGTAGANAFPSAIKAAIDERMLD